MTPTLHDLLLIFKRKGKDDMSAKTNLLNRFRGNGYKVSRKDCQHKDLRRLSRNGKTLWLNIRTKACASYFRKGDRYEYGLPAVCFDRYAALSNSGETVLLAICDRQASKVYIANIRSLSPAARTYVGDKLDSGGTVFLPRDAFNADFHVALGPHTAPSFFT